MSCYEVLEKELVAILDAAGPTAVRVCEGGGPENLAASLAVTVAKFRRSSDRYVAALEAIFDLVASDRELKRSDITEICEQAFDGKQHQPKWWKK